MKHEVPVRLNLGCGNDVRPGWLNVDGFFDHPGVVKADLLDMPWPWEDDTFQVVLMSHVLEHVPFIYHDHNGTQRDIIFRLMEEVHRVLQPGGVFHIKVPLGGTPLGFCHPQHYRQVTPSWADYFHPDSMEGYYTTARFKMVTWKLNRFSMKAPLFMPIHGLGLTSHIKDRLPFLAPLLRRKDELEMTWAALK